MNFLVGIGALRSLFFHTSLWTILVFEINLFSSPIKILALECISLGFSFVLSNFGRLINRTLLAAEFFVIDEGGETELHGVADWIGGSEVETLGGTVVGGEVFFFFGGLATREILPLNGGWSVRGTTAPTRENWSGSGFGFCRFLWGCVEVWHFHPLFRGRVQQLVFYIFYLFW